MYFVDLYFFGYFKLRKVIIPPFSVLSKHQRTGRGGEGRILNNLGVELRSLMTLEI
jgi:hypothetical protein